MLGSLLVLLLLSALFCQEQQACFHNLSLSLSVTVFVCLSLSLSLSPPLFLFPSLPSYLPLSLPLPFPFLSLFLFTSLPSYLPLCPSPSSPPFLQSLVNQYNLSNEPGRREFLDALFDHHDKEGTWVGNAYL